MGITKTLTFNEINGHSNLGNTALYPVTYTGAVFNEKGESVDQLIENLHSEIERLKEDPKQEDPNDSMPINYVLAFTGATSQEEAVSKLNQMDTTNPPRNWSLNSNVSIENTETLYMTAARLQGTKWLKWTTLQDMDKIWSTPVRLGGNTTSTTGIDGAGYNYVYCRTTAFEFPLVPDNLKESLDSLSDTNSFGIRADNGNQSGEATNVWYNHPMGVSADIPYEFALVFRSSGNSYQQITPEPILWSNFGQKGMDGDGVEYIFCLSETEVDNPESLLLDEEKEEDDYIPTNPTTTDKNCQWTDDPQEVSATYKVQYVSKRVKTGGKWRAFSTPTVWNRYTSGTSGAPGQDAVVYTLRCSTNSIVKQNDIFTPATINFKVYKTVGQITSEYKTEKEAMVMLTVTGDNEDKLYKPGTSYDLSVEAPTASQITASFTDPNHITQTLTIPITTIEIPEQSVTNSVLRYIGNWDVLVGYDEGAATSVTPIQFCCNTNTDNNDLTKYVDVVSRSDSKGTTYYKCNQAHVVQEGVLSDNEIPSKGLYWIEAKDLKFLHTEALIAEAITATTLSAKDIVILDEDNKIVAGMTSSKPSTQTGLNSSDVGDVRIWAGSTNNNNIQEAPFRVTEEGELTATNAKIKGSIVATSLTAKDEVTESSMTFRLWHEQDSMNYTDAAGRPVNIEDGTPVLLVEDKINQRKYVVTLTELKSASNNDLYWKAMTISGVLKVGDEPDFSIFKEPHSYHDVLYLCVDSKNNATVQNGKYYTSASNINPTVANGFYIKEYVIQGMPYAACEEGNYASLPLTWNDWVACISTYPIQYQVIQEIDNNIQSLPDQIQLPEDFYAEGSLAQVNIYEYFKFTDGDIERHWIIEYLSSSKINKCKKRVVDWSE